MTPLTNETKTMAHDFVDLDAAPSLPENRWKVEEHQKGGQFKWEPAKMKLYLSKKQDGIDPAAVPAS